MALETASCRLREYIDQGMFIPHRTNFKDLGSSLLSVKEYKDAGGAADGLLMDLGVSSYQIDSADRGFSFSKDGPLDMRMDNSRDDQLTAADICNEYGESGIIDILRTFADESTPRARKIAKSIIDNRPLTTTTDLVNAVAAVTPAFAKNSRRMGRTATLARVFQAMRMIVNEEDSSLTEALAIAAPSIVRPGGRLAVLTYHSLEDRATKRVMKDGHGPWLSTAGINVSPLLDKRARRTVVEKDVYGNEVGPPKPWKMIGKPQKATEAEVEANGRARSATLRVAERLCADGTVSN